MMNQDLFRKLPLREKLEAITQNRIDPNQILTKTEKNISYVHQELSIPDEISNLHLKNLLHK